MGRWCRCDERRTVIVGAASAAVRGDLSRIGPASRFVVETSKEDIAALFRRALRAAKAG